MRRGAVTQRRALRTGDDQTEPAGLLTVLAERRLISPESCRKHVSSASYRYVDMAAQVLGYVGHVSTPRAQPPRLQRLQQGTAVGRKGSSTTTTVYLRRQGRSCAVDGHAEGYPCRPSPAEAPGGPGTASV